MILKKPERADLVSAKKMLRRQIEEYMRAGDPFGVIGSQAALWAVLYVLKHRIDDADMENSE